MGSFIEDGVRAGVEMTLRKIADNTDESASAIHPAFDPKQSAELIAEQTQGQGEEQINDRFRRCLEYHGFRFRSAHELPPLRGRGVRTEGEWRHSNRKVKLAFTPRDLASAFRGAEDLDKYLRDQILAAKVTAGKVAKADLVRSRTRRS